MATNGNRLPEETPFYDTVTMPRSTAAPIARRPSSSGSILANLAEKTKTETIGLVQLLTTIFVALTLIFLGFNAIAFTFFGQGIRAPLQPARTVPLDTKPIKVIPR